MTKVKKDKREKGVWLEISQTKVKKGADNWDRAFKNLKDPDLMFDLVVAGAWIRGNLGGNMPVEEGRRTFEQIKKLLSTHKSKRK